MKIVMLIINIILIILSLLLIIGYEQIADDNQELYWVGVLVGLLIIREYIRPISRLDDDNSNHYDERDIYRD
jgi:hypothetical protein